MKAYNYAEEIIKDNDEWYQGKNIADEIEPEEKIVNEQDQDITLNMEEDKNDADEGFQAFEEGIRNDNISTEEEKENIKRFLKKE
ncbi:hypothetical protein [Ferruginibacter sp.]|uniref:hypothetical protein n=1 Tax=Ferruginibacter sp. TaxID=1940288 RepID=UPI0019912E63|nr:hypothetical protein [Ferruginibacter sp.]MBC7628500.1 hypothetical protein [Ferruginibacter sp.]